MWPLWAFLGLLVFFHASELACAVLFMPSWSSRCE
jgi:hypothetical protein